jgi:hypothetical protein
MAEQNAELSLFNSGLHSFFLFAAYVIMMQPNIFRGVRRERSKYGGKERCIQGFDGET